MRASKRMRAAVLVGAVAFGALGGGVGVASGGAQAQARVSGPGANASASDPTQGIPSDLIGLVMASMTIEEKVGQLFMIDTDALEHGVRADDRQLGISQAQTDNLQRYGPGGIIMFGGNVASASQIAQYVADLQAASPIPLLIAADEEGGTVSRLTAAGVDEFPDMAVIGATGDPGKARQVGETIGRQMAALGFNVDLAPVADVNTNPANPVIGDRAFGSDPALVAAMVAAEVEGLQIEVSATLKHFPGHGDTGSDSHTGLASVAHDLDRLRAVELVPFAAGIEAGAHLILTAHVSAPAIDPSGVPATMSRALLTDVLRGELGFEGLIVTDALDMAAIQDYYSVEDIVTGCIDAGVDILLVPHDFHAAYDTFVALVQSGRISEERVDESLRRILSLKLSQIPGFLGGLSARNVEATLNLQLSSET